MLSGKNKFLEFCFKFDEESDFGLYMEDMLIQLKCWIIVENIMV